MMAKKLKRKIRYSLTLALTASVVAGVMCLNVNAVSAEDTSSRVVINPIAKYEFKDATNHGKDSMGNYDLEFARYYVAGGTGEIMNNGTIDTVNGGVTFTGTGSVAPSAENTGYCLTNTEGADVFDEVSAFTLAFEFQNHAGSTDWATLIGWSNGEKYLGLQDMADADADLNCVGFNCYGTEAGQIWSNAWLQNCGLINENTGTTYQKMLISVQPGGKLSVYVNGQSWLSYDLASDWAINDTAVQFAIGAAYNGNGVAAASGAVRNVQIYDFAMDATAAVEYQTNGVLTKEAPKVINPIAKYEFKDATNHGKDSMGNYDLEFARYYVAGGTGEIMNNGTIDTVNGGVTFTGGAVLSAENPGYCLTNTEGTDVFDEVSAFTLAFEFQNHAGSADWATLIGWSNGEKYLGLQDMADADADLNCVGFNCYGTEAGQIWSNAWFQNCGLINENTGTTYQKMLISVQPGGKLSVYVNGQSWLSYDLASDWAINDTAVQFAIGAAYNGNGVAAASGAVRNVQIYDFAMDSTAALAYQTNGKITTDDVPIVGEVKGNTVTAEEDLGLNFYVDIADATSAKASLQMEGEQATEAVGEYDSAKSLWRFTYPVAAKDYDKNVNFKLTEVDGIRLGNGATDTYSVKTYAEAIANGEYSESAKALVESLVAYCESAKVYFDETLSASAVKVTENVVVKDDLAAYKVSLTGTDEDVTVKGATLALEYKTMIHVYFTATDVSAIAGAEKVDGTDNLYVLKVAVIAKDLGEAQTITIGGYTLTYSAYSYIEMTVDNAAPALYNVLQALYDYGVNAKNYLG